MGNPNYMANWIEESLNQDVAECASGCHRKFFESRLLAFFELDSSNRTGR